MIIEDAVAHLQILAVFCANQGTGQLVSLQQGLRTLSNTAAAQPLHVLQLGRYHKIRGCFN